MPRIDIELTSSRPDGTWTWRAAGARQPKGTLEASLLFPEAKVGDVVRAECEIDLDGTRVTALLPIRSKRTEPERLSIIGSGREEPPVTQDGGPPTDRERPRRDADRRPTGDRRGRGDRPARPDDRSDAGRPAGPRRPGGRPPADGGPRPDRGRDRTAAPRATGGADAGHGPRPARDRAPQAHDGDRAQRGGRDGAPREGDRAPRNRAEQRGRPRADAAPAPARPRPKRLQPGRKYRDAVLDQLPPEQRPVAEMVLRGGIPSVRQAVDEQNARARQAGEPEVRTDALVRLAESLLPRLRAAEWRDRAEAASADADEIGLRDLRAVVAGSDAAGREEESRALVSRLREALDRRIAVEQEAWLGEIRRSLSDGRVVRALRVSGRPPEPGVRFPAELAEELSRAAGEAMTPETTPDRWVALLDAVVSSPIRRTVQPAGVPAERGEDVERALRLAAPRVPALSALLGGTRPPGPRRPPPPRPDAPARRRPPPAHAPPPPAPAAVAEETPPAPVAVEPPPPGAQVAVDETPVPPAPVAAAEVGHPAPAGPPVPEASGDDGDDAVLVEELG